MVVKITFDASFNVICVMVVVPVCDLQVCC